MRGTLEAERGSIRLALAIAATVLAVLIASIWPVVVSQGRHIQDTRAQSQLARVAALVESCRLSAATYAACDEPRELGDLGSLPWGDEPGGTAVATRYSDEQGFTAYAVGASGERIYVWHSRDGQVSKSGCDHAAVAEVPAEGCDGPGW